MMKMVLQNTFPLFSVIIPVFEREKFIKKAIESVLNQSIDNFELIVVDDGSTDNTAYVIKQYKKVKYFYQPNKGVSAARNLGIKKSKGKIVCFLDSDDEWKKDKLKAHLDFFIKNRDYKIHQTDEIWIKNGKFINKKKRHQKKEGFIFYESMQLCLISPSAVAIKKELFNEIGMFDEKFEVCEDYDLWLRITKKYKVGYTPISHIIKHGGHSGQLSKKYFAMDRWRIKALLKHTEDIEAVRVALKKCKILINGALKRKNKTILAEFVPICEKLKNILQRNSMC